ncbi:jmjC domain-containing histone demethylation protein 1 isoform X2 [Teleopsis dalmanni]|uniref:jmjC domain-containing histone demethylation protein 1 isoform X2 n=1 Tax=Teleopsis dalmanni TaxID=139649 RepID=UPI0018CEE39F|nr:jmjC domain-containing histone demethylation protein 1 isoform X2 [Teleopsis dalmanni]
MTEAGSTGKIQKGGQRRQLRERKQRKLYLEEWAIGDDDMEGARGFSVAEKLESSKFAQSGMVREMRGCDLNVAFLQQHGFNVPLLFREKTGLGLRMPDANEFTVNDVRLCVGSRRILDVMDVNTQKNLQMTMKEWQHYYDNPQKDLLLNVISLEFSHTRLAKYIQSPEIVRQIDWVDVVWPKQLKDAQKEGTNVIGEMMYPKVQKYCLMSVKNCYTDFHIDFGGTSVWYHILKGSKVFWLIPPSEKNLQLYEKWVLSGKQSDIFFGDTVEKCARVYLTAGNTFFIPTGWIHAVYTPSESLVFGGNFLHSFGIVKQLKTAQVEDSTKVPQKFRYPFFTEMLWYVLARYVYTLLGHAHLDGEESVSDIELEARPHINLTHYELFGLKEIVTYLYDLPPQKKNVPDLVRDPVALIKDVRTLVERHCKDKPELAVTGVSVLQPQCEMYPPFYIYERSKVKQEIKQEIARKNAELNREIQQLESANTTESTDNKSEYFGDGSTVVDEIKKECGTNGIQSVATFVSPTDSLKYRPPKKMHLANAVAAAATSTNNTVSVIATCSGFNNSTQIFNVLGQNMSSSENCFQSCDSKLSANVTGTGQPRRRRTRCKVCAACQRSDCGECSFCLDMVKFGGPGRAKQTCMMRQCLSPMLPVTAQCVFCHLDGWRQTPISPQTKQLGSVEGPSALMECSVCYEIAHPDCALSKLKDTEEISDTKGIVNEDLPNSWECPSCCRSGKNNDYKPRHFRARQKSSEVRRTSVGGSNLGANEFDSNQLPPPISQYNEFVFTSESEMETGSNLINWKHGTKRHHNLDGKSDRHYEETSSPGVSGDKIKRRRSDDGLSICSSMQDSVDASASIDCNTSGVNIGGQISRKKNSIRSQLAQQMLNSSTRVLKKPQYVVRPAGHHNASCSGSNSNHSSSSNLALDATLLKIIFRYLPQETLVACCSVCKSWSNVAVDPDLWKTMNCAEHKLSASLLTAIVRRQPEHLILDWTQIAKRQLAWIIARLPALKNLSLQNCPIQAVFALHTCLCPPLQILDLSFVRGLNDAAIRDILSPPKDSRPAGTDISDVALRYITQALPHLQHLDLSSCQRITDAGVAQIGTSSTAIANLVELNLSACRLVSESSLEYLSKCDQLVWLDLRHVPQVSTQAVIKFAAKSKHDLCVKDIKLVEQRRTQNSNYKVLTIENNWH